MLQVTLSKKSCPSVRFSLVGGSGSDERDDWMCGSRTKGFAKALPQSLRRSPHPCAARGNWLESLKLVPEASFEQVRTSYTLFAGLEPFRHNPRLRLRQKLQPSSPPPGLDCGKREKVQPKRVNQLSLSVLAALEGMWKSCCVGHISFCVSHRR